MNHKDCDREGVLIEQPILPQKIALPLYAASEYLGLCPIASYASVVLYNYKKKDPNGPLVAHNLSTLHTFTGTKDESWFYTVHVLIELAGAPALQALASVYDSMADNDNEAMAESLRIMQPLLCHMKERKIVIQRHFLTSFVLS